MAEENDRVMDELMSLLESEPASSPAAVPGLTFQLTVSSLRFLFPQANARKQSA